MQIVIIILAVVSLFFNLYQFKKIKTLIKEKESFKKKLSKASIRINRLLGNNTSDPNTRNPDLPLEEDQEDIPKNMK